MSSFRNKDRSFENKKSDMKSWVLSMWKAGFTVKQIADEAQKSRDTIYRWVKEMDQGLAKKSSRKRTLVDEATRFKVMELYVLLARPSIPRLREELQRVFFIQLSEPQLRRYLKRWGLWGYKPSVCHKSIMRERLATEVWTKPSDDKDIDGETFLKSSEHSALLEV